MGIRVDIGAVLDDMGDVYDRLLKDEWTKASIDMEERECILDKFEGEIQSFNQYYGNTKPYGINCAAYSREYEMLSKQYESEPRTEWEEQSGTLSLASYMRRSGCPVERNSTENFMGVVGSDPRLSDMYERAKESMQKCRDAGVNGIVMLDAANKGYSHVFGREDRDLSRVTHYPDVMAISTRTREDGLVNANITIEPKDKVLVEMIGNIADERFSLHDFQETGKFQISIEGLHESELDGLYTQISDIAGEYQHTEWSQCAEKYEPDTAEEEYCCRDGAEDEEEEFDI